MAATNAATRDSGLREGKGSREKDVHHWWQHNDFELTEFKSEQRNDAADSNMCQRNCKALRLCNI